MSTTRRNPTGLFQAPRGPWPRPLAWLLKGVTTRVRCPGHTPRYTAARPNDHSTPLVSTVTGLDCERSGRPLSGSLRVSSIGQDEPRPTGAQRERTPQASVGETMSPTYLPLVPGSPQHQDISSCAEKAKCPLQQAPPLLLP